MSKTYAAVIFLLLLLLLEATAPAAFALPDEATAITLYAHAPPATRNPQEPVLNALAQWGSQQSLSFQNGLSFTLDPALGGNVSIEGTVVVRLWVRGDRRVSGFMGVSLAELRADGTSRLAYPVFNDTAFLDTAARDFNVGLVGVTNVTFSAGSRIQLNLKFTTTERFATAYVLYDSPTTPTQITVRTRRPTLANIIFQSPSGEPEHIFEAKNESSTSPVRIRMNLTDVFGAYRLSSATLSILDSTGSVVYISPNILNATQLRTDYTLVYQTSVDAPIGTYTADILITDISGSSSSFIDHFFVAVFYPLDVRVLDGNGHAIVDAVLMVNTAAALYPAVTNQTGWAMLKVPSSTIVGPYQVQVSFRNVTLPPASISVLGSTSLPLVLPVFDARIRVKVVWFDLPGGQVDLKSASGTIASAITNSSGHVTFTQIPSGIYSLRVRYSGIDSETEIRVDGNEDITVQVPLPFEAQLPYWGILIFALAAITVMLRRRKFYEGPFNYIDFLTKGGFPDSCAAIIAGGSGSGKTALTESLAHRALTQERSCIYVTNVDLPSTTRTAMERFGMDVDAYESKGRLVFIDCYSALSGVPSKEKRAVTSFTDLTSLGIQITQSLDSLNGKVDVYLDSLTPFFTALKPDFLISFLQSVGAKIKSYNGRFFATIGTSIEKETLSRIEENADCVVETQLNYTRTGQERRLRIKKLRDHPHIAGWTKFKITDNGIIFLTRKPFKANDLRQ